MFIFAQAFMMITISSPMPQMANQEARRKMPTSKAGSWNRNSGFTLVELVVVVLLIGLFSMLVLPMLTGIGEDSLGSSARRIAGTVKYLFNESALTGREHRLIFNLDRGIYFAKTREDGGEVVEATGLGKEQRLRGDVRFKDVYVASKGKSSTGEVTTEIHPVGWLEETIIHLENGRGETLTLRIEPFTGSTEISEGYRELSAEG
jgi:general secretion pathway protein H